MPGSLSAISLKLNVPNDRAGNERNDVPLRPLAPRTLAMENTGPNCAPSRRAAGKE